MNDTVHVRRTKVLRIVVCDMLCRRVGKHQNMAFVLFYYIQEELSLPHFCNVVGGANFTKGRRFGAGNGGMRLWDIVIRLVREGGT